MDRLLLVGAGGFGRVMLEHASLKYECAFLDDQPELGTEINGCKVVGRISDIEKLHREYELLIVSIGDNMRREELYKSAKQVGYTFPSKLYPQLILAHTQRLEMVV